MKTIHTYRANIWVGLRKEYTNTVAPASKVTTLLQEYCNKDGFCVSVTQTEFIYTNGNEPGLNIGIINYPRFPSTLEEIQEKCIILAKALLEELEQERCTIVLDDKTIMIGKEDIE